MADVPRAQGVPPPLTGFNNTIPPAPLNSDLIASLGAPIPQWGIFLNGALIITADTVTDFTYKQEWVIADYPLQRGAFESYDKVALPYEPRIRFVAGGSEANRQALLGSIMTIAGDYNLYDVVTPTAVYTSSNVRSYEYRRTAQNGLGLLQVDVRLQWVRVTGGTGSLLGLASNLLGGLTGNANGLTVGDASAADQVNDGSVQASPPTGSQGTIGSID